MTDPTKNDLNVGYQAGQVDGRRKLLLQVREMLESELALNNIKALGFMCVPRERDAAILRARAARNEIIAQVVLGMREAP